MALTLNFKAWQNAFDCSSWMSSVGVGGAGTVGAGSPTGSCKVNLRIVCVGVFGRSNVGSSL